jgi:outer membrane lipoprotein SlyB
MKTLIYVATIVIALAVTGCSTTSSSSNAHVSWNAKAQGTIFVVDEATQKTVFTQTVDGVRVEFNAANKQEAERFLAIPGLSSTNCLHVFYFVPKH